MNDETPRVPKLWWSPKFGVIEQIKDEYYCNDENIPSLSELPMNVVRLVPLQSIGEVYEIWNRISHQRANERIYESANDALKMLENSGAKAENFRVQAVTFQHAIVEEAE